ncbi:recombinase family protein [Herbiconiux sp. VKM Ac-2851]|uniref:recombinase family protein n=1 Tax=Herbiconiux sp. VKM Ac-2851 TaxID=2739025 RepID=UPI0015633ACD|nr:recombinase family protein [Herbiconiux sp. VKM Ac-2851]NQX34041.1 recombinase family protein [Herbiconiux sp. VKM Ac-2851]
MTRAAIYARISQKDESFDKVESQLDRCQQFADREGYTVTRIFTDDGISAWSGKERPGFLDLLSAVTAEEIDVVVAVAQDRLSRNDTDWLALKVACQRSGALVHTIANGKVDSQDPSSVAMAGMLQVLADMESASKSQKIRARITTARAAGSPLWGRVPFGYSDRHTAHPEEGPLVTQAYADVLEGKTLYSIARRFNDAGHTTRTGKPFNGGAIRDILQRPRNARLVESYGVIQDGQEGDWEAIVDLPSWQSVNKILANPARRKSHGANTTFLLAGVARCGICGEVMRSASASKNGIKTAQYRCSSKTDQRENDGRRHTTARRDDLDTAVLSEVVRVFHEEYIKPDLQEVEHPSGAVAVYVKPRLPKDPNGPARDRIEVRLAEIREARANLLALAAMPGFDILATSRQAEQLQTEEAALIVERDAIAEADARSGVLAGIRDAMLSGVQVQDLAPSIDRALRALPIDKQRALVQSMFTVTVHHGKGAHRFEIAATARHS